ILSYLVITFARSNFCKATYILPTIFVGGCCAFKYSSYSGCSSSSSIYFVDSLVRCVCNTLANSLILLVKEMREALSSSGKSAWSFTDKFLESFTNLPHILRPSHQRSYAVFVLKTNNNDNTKPITVCNIDVFFKVELCARPK